MTSKISLLDSGRLNCQIPDYKTKISKLSKEHKPGSLYASFIKKFLSYIAIDYDFENKLKLFYNFADEAFSFFKQKINNERKISITNVVIENDPAINILILLDNKPHIVDFIVCLLKKMILQTKFLLHPVMNCTRTDKGDLAKILENSISNKKLESVLHLTILGNFDDNATTSLIQDINDRLDELEQSYNALPSILTKLQNLSKNIIDNDKLNPEEAKEFLNWLQNDNLILLGVLDFELESVKLNNEIGTTKIRQEVKDEIEEILKCCSANPLYQNQLIILGKINSASLIQADNLIDYILVHIHTYQNAFPNRGSEFL